MAAEPLPDDLLRLIEADQAKASAGDADEAAGAEDAQPPSAAADKRPPGSTSRS